MCGDKYTLMRVQLQGESGKNALMPRRTRFRELEMGMRCPSVLIAPPANALRQINIMAGRTRSQ